MSLGLWSERGEALALSATPAEIRLVSSHPEKAWCRAGAASEGLAGFGSRYRLSGLLKEILEIFIILKAFQMFLKFQFVWLMCLSV